MNQKDDLDPRLSKQLALIQDVPPRDASKEALGRAAFLRELAEMRQAVSVEREVRHMGWIDTIRAIFTPRKEMSPMFGTLATILLILSLAFGGSGITVAAAQASLPDEPLYGLKLWSEDARLRLNADPQAQFELALRLVSRRSNEVQAMVAEGKMPSDAVMVRYQAQVEQALRLAIGMPDDAVFPALVRLQEQLRRMEQAAQTSADPLTEAVQIRIRTMLQERIAWIDGAPIDPDQLRHMLRERDQNQDQNRDQDRLQQRSGTPAVTGTAQDGGKQTGPGNGNCGECTPASTPQGGNHPWTDTPPTPGSGYGSGAQPTDNSDTGLGPQPTENPGPGPGPRPTDNPGPGSGSQPTEPGGSGPGEQPTQAQPQPQPQPQPSQSGSQPPQSGPKIDKP